MSGPDSATSARQELVRGVGLWAAIAVNVANMIGTGVFLKTRVMTCNVGSAKTVLAVWFVAGLLSLAGTFSYSEIAAMMPEAGGDYLYLRRAYGRLMGFLYGWMVFAVARAGSQAALAVGLAIFMNVALAGVLESWHMDGVVMGLHMRISGLTMVALATIWTVALINCASVATGGHTALVVTIAKVLLVFGVGLAAFVFAPVRVARDLRGGCRQRARRHRRLRCRHAGSAMGLRRLEQCSAARRRNSKSAT
jgi:basic amino acid/polyamine antiporter, APA family